jgi:hypothetical protein
MVVYQSITKKDYVKIYRGFCLAVVIGSFMWVAILGALHFFLKS